MSQYHSFYRFERCDTCGEGFETTKFETELLVGRLWSNWLLCEECFTEFHDQARVKKYRVWTILIQNNE